jgi:hypothetical protein
MRNPTKTENYKELISSPSKSTLSLQTAKFAELLLLTIACILLTALLSGCNTTQTLGAQFGISPLPTAVARKLYGTCGACDLNPNCPVCLATQKYNRKLAAAPASQKREFATQGTSYARHQAMLENYTYNNRGNQSYQGYQGYQGYRNYDPYQRQSPSYQTYYY